MTLLLIDLGYPGRGSGALGCPRLLLRCLLLVHLLLGQVLLLFGLLRLEQQQHLQPQGWVHQCSRALSARRLLPWVGKDALCTLQGRCGRSQA